MSELNSKSKQKLLDNSPMHRPMRKTASNSTQKSYSPSFTSYFNTGLADIAVRVTNEFTELDDDNDAYLIQCLKPEPATSSNSSHTQIRSHNKNSLRIIDETNGEIEEENEESSSSSNSSHTQIRSHNKNSLRIIDETNGEIEEENEEELESEFEFDLANLVPPNGDLGPVYPVFNRDLLLGDSFNPPPESSIDTSKVQIQLKSLFLDEHRDDPRPPTTAGSSSSSSSDSEEEELDSIPPGTYCVWTPNKSPLPPSPSPNRCTKSNSTGSASAASSSSAAGKAKEFRLRDLLKRSKSDGNDGVMLITPLSKQKKATSVVKGKAVMAPGVRGSPARESYEYHYYRRGREGESGNARRKSYLPYKQDLVGFFVTPHGLRKIQLPPFS